MSDDNYSYMTSTPEQWEKLKPRAQEMRHNPTPAEQILWERLRNRRLKDVKFRRQHPIIGFIVDFICLEHMLIVEVDGDIHDLPDQQAYDQDRQAVLESLGYYVLRFQNQQITDTLDKVLDVIASKLTSPATATRDGHSPS